MREDGLRGGHKFVHQLIIGSTTQAVLAQARV